MTLTVPIAILLVGIATICTAIAGIWFTQHNRASGERRDLDRRITKLKEASKRTNARLRELEKR